MGAARLRVAALATLLVLTMAVTAAAVLTPTSAAVGTHASAWSFVTALLLLTAQTAATGVVVSAARNPPDHIVPVGTRILRRAARSLLALGGFELLVAIVIDVPAAPTLGEAARLVVRGLLWAGLGLLVCVVVRRRRTADDVLLLLLVPPTVLVLAACLTAALGASFTAAVGVVTNPLIVSGIAALVVVPSVLALSAIRGLQDTHDRGLRLARLIERRPRVVLMVLGANLVVLAALVLAVSARPGPVLLRHDLRACIAAVLVALVLIGTLTLDRRLGLDADDHREAGTLLTLVVAVPIAVVVSLAMGVATVSLLLSRPWVTGGLVALPVCVLLLRRTPGLRGRLLAPAAVVSGVLLSLVARLRTGVAPAGARLFAWESSAVTGHGVALLLLLGGVAFAGAVLVALLVGRPRLLLYLGGVAVWTGLVAGADAWAGGGSTIAIDLVLTLLLGGLAVAWIAGRQQEVDGFEIVLTVVVTTTLWVGPVVLALAPARLAPWLLVAALVLPGLTAVVGGARSLRRQGEDAAPDLARWCLTYALLGALVWVTGGAVAGLPDQVSSGLLAYVLLPLAMLLVVLSSAGRTRRPAAASRT